MTDMDIDASQISEEHRKARQVMQKEQSQSDEQPTEEEKTQSEDKPKRQYKCHNCGEAGHFAKTCKKPKKKVKAKGEESKPEKKEWPITITNINNIGTATITFDVKSSVKLPGPGKHVLREE